MRGLKDFLSAWHSVMVGFLCQLAAYNHLNGISVKELSVSSWPVVISVGHCFDYELRVQML